MHSPTHKSCLFEMIAITSCISFRLSDWLKGICCSWVGELAAIFRYLDSMPGWHLSKRHFPPGKVFQIQEKVSQWFEKMIQSRVLQLDGYLFVCWCWLQSLAKVSRETWRVLVCCIPQSRFWLKKHSWPGWTRSQNLAGILKGNGYKRFEKNIFFYFLNKLDIYFILLSIIISNK